MDSLFERKYLYAKQRSKSYPKELEKYYLDPITRVSFWYLQSRKPTVLEEMLGPLYSDWEEYYGSNIRIPYDIVLRKMLPDEVKKRIPYFEVESSIFDKLLLPVSDPDNPLNKVLPLSYIAILSLEDLMARIEEKLDKVPTGKAGEGFATILSKIMEIYIDMIEKERERLAQASLSGVWEEGDEESSIELSEEEEL